jgi:2-polyprenyl-3-methyl-5-hydroxy-6-metoxy-1,4-benzoquinol methylase
MDLVEHQKIDLKKFKRHPWELARFQILSFFLSGKNSGKFIVDVGSGDAFIARQLSAKFPEYQLAAVDINYDPQFILANKQPNLLLLKNIGEVPNDKPIDAVLLMDVLEHMEKPEQLLHDIRKLAIISSTQFIITVPAFQTLFSQHDIFLKHFKRYSRAQLIEMMRKEGFEITESGYFFASLLILRVLQKLFKMHPKQGLHNWEGSSFQTNVIASILWIDFKISWYLSRIGIILPGLSCYCICHPLPS